MDAAWEKTINNDVDGVAKRILEELPRESLEETRARVLTIERASASSADPLRYLRASILDATDLWTCSQYIDDALSRAVAYEEEPTVARGIERVLSQEEAARHNTVFGGVGEVGSLAAYLIGKILSRVLRAYTAASYRDRARHDWLDWYIESSMANLETLRERVELQTQGKCEESNVEMYAQWKQSMIHARTEALNRPIGKTIHPIPRLTWP